MDSDIVMSGSDDVPVRRPRGPRNFVVSVDFGTTFSSVAYLGYYDVRQRPRLGREHVRLVDRYPLDPYANVSCYVVPSELWYSQRIARSVSHSRGASAQPQLVDINMSGDNNDDGDDGDDGDDSDSETSSEDTPNLHQLSCALSMANGNQESLFWGNAVQDQLAEASDETKFSRYLSRFKLILDDSIHTEKQRNILSESCNTLRKMLSINEDTDVIADYLTQLFRHTKERLIDSEEYTDISTVEFVLCVPAIWKSEALRHMQVAMNTAIKNSGLGKLQHGSINNLFIVTEPEAAAAWILAKEGKARIKFGDTFILLDAGGGTVDAITYTVDKHYPLRLKTEEVDAGGAMCGSSFINERFGDLLFKKLKNEQRYLDLCDKTLSQVINGVVVEFERRDKKNMDLMFPDRVAGYTVKVPGLKERKKKGFLSGKMVITAEQIKELFEPSLKGVAEVMKEQFRLARAKGCEVQKIILMGGFGQSKSLSSYLRAILETECGLAGQNVVLESSTFSTSSVASGGILRALRKEDGPERIVQSSYGFLRPQRYGEQEAHAGQIPVRDKIDGFDYIHSIDWIINKGDLLTSEAPIVRKVEYTFHIKKKKLIGMEYLYVSDRRHEQHFQWGHPNNIGAVKHGYVEVDMTHLRDKGQIKPYSPKEKGKLPYWYITGKLLIFVNGRNLRYEVHLDKDDGEVQSIGSISLAAAFRPGTE